MELFLLNGAVLNRKWINSILQQSFGYHFQRFSVKMGQHKTKPSVVTKLDVGYAQTNFMLFVISNINCSKTSTMAYEL